MFGLETLSSSVQAVVTVGLVLTEAITLYVGYGIFSSVAGETVLEMIGGDQ
ncbi:hypothetical protein SAMN05421858_4497 [Haladaptatus litoreus]|uniref:Uncharacterized protein n=1 Tax=Haladaptatus litoreus TaxID=553468 RepID=A0A1N7EU79_9EURY|nr:hypothetical protein [Haladaptatus litoreus]SIR91579.1 hypothetical protein SAMN05421858_4497 [Haladaptatus litoreus]